MAGIKFGSGTQNHHCKNIGGLKFSGLVRDHHAYNYMQVKKKYWPILIWHLQRKTAKSPNLISCKTFWLYSIIIITAICIASEYVYYTIYYVHVPQYRLRHHLYIPYQTDTKINDKPQGGRPTAMQCQDPCSHQIDHGCYNLYLLLPPTPSSPIH